MTAETIAGEHDLRSVIDDSGIDIDVVQSTDPDADDAVVQYVDEYGTGLYDLAFQVSMSC
ncbi:hypothetical protein [Natrinema sp. DC36]|uniref:hypothetical protein n=1 Tax=Natrinema sp. DC36 TaxID=2878680 RepID=UPI001CF0CFA8|nr:hypothetical protein [Natrinema sp. DC36]